MMKDLHPYIRAGRALLAGLVIAQIIAGVSVHRSNADLAAQMWAIDAAGYLTVPSKAIWENAAGFRPAVFGGLFFTLSVGAFLSMAAMAAAWLWKRIFRRRRRGAVLLILFWAALVILGNAFGFRADLTAYLVLVPFPVFFLAQIGAPDRQDQCAVKSALCHLAAFLLVCGIAGASGRLTADAFVLIRDHALLSNPVGKEVNDFYYRYTLYPAGVFKFLDQKVLKTCALTGFDDPALQRRVARTLVRRDYIPLSGAGAPLDLTIQKQGDLLMMHHKGEKILLAELNKFLRSPEKVLRQFSELADDAGVFRGITFLSILANAALGAYLLVCFFIVGVIRLLRAPTPSPGAAPLICFMVGTTLMLLIPTQPLPSVSEADLPEILAAEHPYEQVAALKRIYADNLDIGRFPVRKELADSPSIPVRYWLAKALGLSRSRATFDELVALLDDPDFNVVYAACHALGKRRDRRAIREILKRYPDFELWYVQEYAYKALKRLGWRQRRSG